MRVAEPALHYKPNGFSSEYRFKTRTGYKEKNRRTLAIERNSE